MAKKVQRQWEGLALPLLSVTQAAPSTSQVVIASTVGEINQGVVRLCRVLGCVNARISNWVTGDLNVHLWHGLIQVDSDTSGTSVQPVPMGASDENEGAWLWREPIPLFAEAHLFPEQPSGWIVSHRIDWAVRGGKGSGLRPEAKILYVLGCNTDLDATTSLGVRAPLLLLFAST